MRIFEFIFNPKLKKDVIFDSFCYEPKTIYEKNKGSLYMVGFLKNTLPNNIYLIKNIARTIKDKYFQLMRSTSEASLKEGLKSINTYLSNKAEKGNVSWLGNLSFAVLSIKKSRLIFSKTGDIKILILRNGEFIDIDDKTKYNEASPYPIKIFSKTISGKLKKNDFILVFTRNVYDFFKKNKLLKKTLKLSSFSEEEIKNIFDVDKKKTEKTYGVFLGISLDETTEETNKKMTLKNLEKTPFKEIVMFFLYFFKKIKIPSFNVSLPKRKKRPKIKSLNGGLKINHKSIGFLSSVFLLIVLVLSFFVFQIQKKNKENIFRKKIIQIEQEISVADSLSGDGSTDKANVVLQNSWNNFILLKEKSSQLSDDLKSSVDNYQKELLSRLYKLNNIIDVENPEIFFKFSENIFTPDRFLLSGEKLYFYNHNKHNIFYLNQNKNNGIIETRKSFDLSTNLEDTVVFYTRPNQLTVLKNNYPSSSFLNIKDSDVNNNDLGSFNNNLYFLNKQTGQIIKYPSWGNNKWGLSGNWISSNTDLKPGASSFTIDRSIWLLSNNLIYRYFVGELVQTINLNIFPNVKNLSKIFISSGGSRLYVSEPSNQRIIILDRNGKYVKQIRSDKFDNILDFSVSVDEKYLYVLNNLNLYRINL